MMISVSLDFFRAILELLQPTPALKARWSCPHKEVLVRYTTPENFLNYVRLFFVNTS